MRYTDPVKLICGAHLLYHFGTPGAIIGPCFGQLTVTFSVSADTDGQQRKSHYKVH